MSLPPSEIPLGAMRFNSDSQKLEYWNGESWFQIQTFSPNLGNSTSGVRGIFMGGDPSRDDNMDYITIPTRGNAVDFGNYTISNGTGNRGIIGSGTRGFGCGGESPSQGDSHNFIGKWEFASTGSSIDFANLTFTMKGGAGLSNGTRAVITRGASGGLNNNDICFFTMASQQDAVDFGDNQSGSTYLACGTASPTRGVIICGRDTSGTANIIEFITIATTGNSQDFGDAVNTENAVATCAGGNSTRGVLAGGGDSSTTDVSYITYATTGNTVKFGDLHTGNGYAAPASDRITLVTGGGNAGGNTNRMDAVAIATGGTSTDFGDLNDSKTVMTGSSNGHGGLG
tara:strand:- start:664 stop:1689 length:1026 start_codon:yes stop_codon:yes gene_type:complete